MCCGDRLNPPPKPDLRAEPSKNNVATPCPDFSVPIAAPCEFLEEMDSRTTESLQPQLDAVTPGR
jgi:hypothetical protein